SFATILLACATYYTMAVLVQLNGTTRIRFALLPIVLWTSWSVMPLEPPGDATQLQTNIALSTGIVIFSGRSIAWAFVKEPFRRLPFQDKDSAPHGKRSNIPVDVSESQGNNICKALWDACDLVLNVRGIGWSWSCSRYARYGTPQSRAKFLLKTIAHIACDALAADVAVETARTILPATTGPMTIIDTNLPFPQQLLHASILSAIYISVIYFMVDLYYRTVAFCCVAVLLHRPEQWPPLFDDPWRSTSLGDFWGKRWHQLLRDYVVSLGSQPLMACLTKLSALSVLAAFFVSGILHDISFRSMRKGGEPVQMIFFVMQGVGVVLERAFSERWVHARLRKSPWSRVAGRVWTFSWLLVWGIPFVESNTRADLFRIALFPESLKP
ncbi:hypothetical protein SCLCIDRAFT_51832, partial [Scleroderma citrinum Foug A]